MKLAILMPAYNKGECIFDNISTTVNTLNEIGIDHEVVVVNDGSTDNTHQEVFRASKKFSSSLTSARMT